MEKMKFEILSPDTNIKYLYGFNDYAFHHGSHSEVEHINSVLSEEALGDGFAKVIIRATFLVKRTTSVSYKDKFYNGELKCKISVTFSSVQKIYSKNHIHDNVVVTASASCVGQSEFKTSKGTTLNKDFTHYAEEKFLEDVNLGLYPEFVQPLNDK